GGVFYRKSYFLGLRTEPNAAVVRWLARHQPEFLKEFQSIAELTELSWGSHESDAAQLEPAAETQE
ncbi:MAG: hypothetical protein ACTIAS_01465, partial [Pseudomonas helleri]